MSEQEFELDVLDWLSAVSWDTHGDASNEGGRALDAEYGRSKDEVVYWPVFRESVRRINNSVTSENIGEVVRQVKKRLTATTLIDANRKFHSCLRAGVTVPVETDSGEVKKRTVDLVDFDNPTNNSFVAVNQFRVEDGSDSRRPDIVLFVNGLPLVVVELKDRKQSNTYKDAYRDLHKYEEEVPRLFVPNLFNIAASNIEFRYGAIGAPETHYNPWRPPDAPRDGRVHPEDAFKTICQPETLVSLLDDFVFYQNSGGGTAKVIPRHQQYYATHEIEERVCDAEEKGIQGRGLLWHTQGSGKSFAMLYAARSLARTHNAQVIIVVDTKDLNEQMEDELNSIRPGFKSHRVAESKEHLQDILEQGQSGIILTTIQKFEGMPKDIQGNSTTVVMADEAHRFMEADLGMYLEAALANAHHFGFTGTPVEEGEQPEDRNTWVNYHYEDANDELYLHRYSTTEACAEGVITPVDIECRDGIELVGDSDVLDESHRNLFPDLSEEERRKHIQEKIDSGILSEVPQYVDGVTNDIISHYESVVRPKGMKGMVVTRSRESAALYGSYLQSKVGEESVEVLYSPEEDDSERLERYHKTKGERSSVVDDFKETNQPEILVVCNMLLTGFDAPILRTMYLDRPLRDHRLLQAIARTNRTRAGKEFGEIIDYTGVTRDIDEMFDYASDELETYLDKDKERLFRNYADKIDAIFEMFNAVDRNDREDLGDWLDCLDDEGTQEEFKQRWRALDSLHSNLAPDIRLRDYKEKYDWIRALARAVDPNPPSPEYETFRQDTAELIGRHSEVNMNSEGEGNHITTITGDKVDGAISGGPVEVTRKKSQLVERLVELERLSPQYKTLAERVKDLTERWNEGNLSDEDVLSKFEDIEEDVDAAEEEFSDAPPRKRGELAVKHLLEERYTEKLANSDATDAIARAIIDACREVNRRYDGINKKIYKEYRKEVRWALIQVNDEEPSVEEPETSLAGDKAFVEDAVQYVHEIIG